MKLIKPTKKNYEEYLNSLELQDDRMRRRSKYGAWLRQHDPIAFNAGYQDWKKTMEYDQANGIQAWVKQ